VTPTIAVVVPTRDRPSVLAAVESVVAQEVDASVSVVVVDDGSRVPVTDELRDRFPEIRVLRHEPPRGPGAARNAGAAASPADFVAYLDDDDRWLPGKLRTCLSCFDRWPQVGMVFHRVAYRSEVRAAPTTCRPLADGRARMLHRQPPHLDGVMVRGAIHDAVRFDESFDAAEDLDYVLRVALAAPVGEVPDVLAVHGPAGRSPSWVSVARRIEGHQRFRAKHHDLFDRKARAFSDVRLGHLYRRAGRHGQAAREFLRAAMERPLWGLPWKGLVAAALPTSAVERISGVGGLEEERVE
jgi:glycosyltransferase involved in cell wall biosynthesis